MFLVINTCVYLISGIVVYYKGNKIAPYYLASWGLFGFFATWASLEYTGILTFDSFSKYLNPLGVVLETIISSLGLAYSINVLKRENQEIQKANLDLIKTQKESLEAEVKRRTEELEEKNQEIGTQNEELHQQKEELLITNEHFEKINIRLKDSEEILKKSLTKFKESESKVKEQNAELTQKQLEMISQNEKLFQQKKEIALLNTNLESLVSQRTQELKDTLDNLTKQNQDLSQFSYIISHNLRAPVARILGLVNIFNEKDYNDDFNKQIFSHLKQTSIDLNVVIKDLTQIITIRNDLSKTKEEINILDIINVQKFLLQSEIERSKAIIDTELISITSIRSIKAYVQSILYNLLSNAIKYKSDKRIPIIKLQTEVVDDFVCLSVQDNGLGIDLEKIDTYKIFGLYQRMHNHVKGKGLGLFLVKTQIESMGGRIEIESQLDVGTTFKVYFPYVV